MLIFLTGFSGSGKTTAAERFKDLAFRIDGDHFHFSAMGTLRPELPKEHRNNWRHWPNAKRTPETAARILGVTLPREFPGLLDHRDHVIADGAIFANDWFRLGCLDAMTVLGMSFDGVRLLYVDLPDKELFANIHARASADPGRGHELERFRTVEDVARENAGFRRCFGPSLPRWERVVARGELDRRLWELLRG